MCLQLQGTANDLLRPSLTSIITGTIEIGQNRWDPILPPHAQAGTRALDLLCGSQHVLPTKLSGTTLKLFKMDLVMSSQQADSKLVILTSP